MQHATGRLTSATLTAVIVSAAFIFAAASSASGDIIVNGVNTGTTEFRNDGTVDTVTVNGVGYSTTNYGTVNIVALSETGHFWNYGTVDTVTLNGGTFIGVQGTTVNNASINRGAYSNAGYTGNLYVGYAGSLETGSLHGSIGNLSFDPYGVGFLMIKGTSSANFGKVNADGNVDLTGAKVQLEFLVNSVLEPDFRIDLATVFNFIGDGGFSTDNWWEDVYSVKAKQGVGYVALDNLGDGWFGFQTAVATPEPATMLIVGLGLAGLGLASRRRKNK
ncbi:MAG: PEP-CTERM sorting domain-containing protein [Planctomycetaceae bacterium]|jgi:hypothetical protein|nr:PEP-CTERM sorting domain-containing protein [Planctomycetaceae bacterium]